MSEQSAEKAKWPKELSDILLVFDKEKKKIQAVKSIDENGKMQTVDPTHKNQNQFMRVDRNGDFFSNFFSNFLSQLKNPTNFSFFKVPFAIGVDTAKEMQQHADNPTSQGELLMLQHEIKASEPTEDKKENNPINKNHMEATQTNAETSEYRYKPEQIDWETMNHLGLSKEKLEKLNLLEPMLKGYKTNELVPINLNLGTAVTRLDARLSLKMNEEGEVVVAIHGIRKGPNLNYPFFGHEFSTEDKDNLLKTGNMGRVVNLTNPKTDEVLPSVISVDRLTNEVVAFRADYIKIPDEIKGVKLSEYQKQTLLEGKPLPLEGMISKKGEPFDATVQFNADKRFVEFLFDRNNGSRQVQGNGYNQTGENLKNFRGKELDEQQQQKLQDGQTVYISGLIDKKGREYNGYITLNKESGRTEFSFDNPSKMKEQAKPAEENKVQTAVNSEGKTNEATKKLQEPLRSGQSDPETQKQQEEQQAETKSKGRKM